MWEVQCCWPIIDKNGRFRETYVKKIFEHENSEFAHAVYKSYVIEALENWFHLMHKDTKDIEHFYQNPTDYIERFKNEWKTFESNIPIGKYVKNKCSPEFAVHKIDDSPC